MTCEGVGTGGGGGGGWAPPFPLRRVPVATRCRSALGFETWGHDVLVVCLEGTVGDQPWGLRTPTPHPTPEPTR